MTRPSAAQHAVRTLPSTAEMLSAFMTGDADYDGVFFTAVKTTGIFCRPACPARKPRPENVEFFATTGDALFAGYRPCRRCCPMDAPETTPDWVSRLMASVAARPDHRWRDADLRDCGVDPERARRWFQKHHGMTFHAYARSLRLGEALKAISDGGRVTDAALDHGFDSLSGFGEAMKRLTGRSPAQASTVIRFRRLDTALGPMIAGASEQGLCLLEFADRRAIEAQLRTLGQRLDAALVPGSNAHLEHAATQLGEYFAGQRRSFSVPLVLRGTAFQESVWQALLEIPPGATCSYVDIARRVGRPGAVRAVGTANGANRIAIMVPCHRVIGADGKLAGYGGGLWRKQKLLELEAQSKRIEATSAQAR